MKPSRRASRQGFVIPLAAGFSVIMAILLGATGAIRTQSARQNKTTFQMLKTQFLAQGVIQTALLKYRVLPNEGFEASEANDVTGFLSDVGTDAIGLAVAVDGTWEAKIEEGAALNSVIDGQDWLHVIKLTAVATVEDGTRGTDGSVETRTDQVEKTVEVRKKRVE